MHNSSATVAIFGPSSDIAEINTQAELGRNGRSQRFTAGRAASGRGRAVGNGCRRPGAAREATLPAIRTRHHGDQFFDQRIAVDLQELVGDPRMMPSAAPSSVRLRMAAIIGRIPL
jgi:hypothetical protein